MPKYENLGKLPEILQGWVEIEAFTRITRRQWKKWVKDPELGCPILPGSGSRPPIASKWALERFLILISEDKLYEKAKRPRKKGRRG